MKTILSLIVGVLMALPATAVAQPPGRMSPRDRLELERQVIERFATQVGDQLDLSRDDRVRVRDWLVATSRRRRELARETMELRHRLAAAVQAPETTDAQFEQLLDELRDVRRRELEALQTDERQLSEWLNPRQRAQLFVGLGRFQERIRDIISERGRRPR